MKKAALITLFILLATSAVGQKQLTVFYYGATDCGPCNRPEVIASINKLKADFASLHTDFKTKFVMVAVDNTIEEGLQFINKYDPWDEVAMGSRYNNELALANLNGVDIPGLPHIFVFEDEFENAGYGVVVREKRTLLKKILGGEPIVSWVNSGMKLE